VLRANEKKVIPSDDSANDDVGSTYDNSEVNLAEESKPTPKQSLASTELKQKQKSKGSAKVKAKDNEKKK
jgi:hypothetical protein